MALPSWLRWVARKPKPYRGPKVYVHHGTTGIFWLTHVFFHDRITNPKSDEFARLVRRLEFAAPFGELPLEMNVIESDYEGVYPHHVAIQWRMPEIDSPNPDNDLDEQCDQKVYQVLQALAEYFRIVPTGGEVEPFILKRPVAELAELDDIRQVDYQRIWWPGVNRISSIGR